MTEKQREDTGIIAKKYGLALVLLFGSQARGRIHSESDVDVGFVSDSPMTLREMAQLQFEFSQKLRIQNLELVSMGGASSLFLHQVATEGRPLYESTPGAFTSFVSYAFKRFVEEKPLRALKLQSLRTFSISI